MPGAIVVGTDGSETAQRAVLRAGEIAQALGTSVHVVSSYDPTMNGAWMASAGGFAVASAVTDSEAREYAEQTVDKARECLAPFSVMVDTHVCQGEAADALSNYAAAHDAQMIVVGNRGMSGARRVLGSVPNRVSHRARCAVLIVPTG